MPTIFNRYLTSLLVFILFAVVLPACSKHGSSGPPDSSGGPDNLTGGTPIPLKQYLRASLGVNANPTPYLGALQTGGSLLVGSPLTRVNADGSLDKTFGVNGFLAEDKIFAVGKQSSGSYVVMTQKTVNRYFSDGSLDRVFAVNISPMLPLINGSGGSAGLLIAPDDSVYFFSGYGTSLQAPIYRIKKDGVPDITFGPNGNGIVANLNGSFIYALGLSSTGKIYVLTDAAGGDSFQMIRLNNSGGVEVRGPVLIASTIFNGGTSTGMTSTISKGVMSQLLVQSDDKVVLMGVTSTKGAGLIRLNADGSLDTTFGTKGAAVAPTGTSVLSAGIGFSKLSSGNYAVAVSATNTAASVLVVSELTSAGLAVPKAFGNTNFISLVLPSGLALSPYLQTGNNDRLHFVGALANPTKPIQVSCLTLDKTGALDTTFGNSGVTSFYTPGSPSFIDFKSQASGKMVAALGYFAPANNSQAFELIRLNADGSLDSSFNNTAGFWSFDLVSKLNFLNATSQNNATSLLDLRVGADSSVWVLGSALSVDSTTTHFTLFLSHLSSGGVLDTTFGNAGLLVLDNSATQIAPLANGKIALLLTGIPAFGTTTATFPQVLRLNADGTADATFGTKGIFGLPNFSTTGGAFERGSLGVNSDGSLMLAFSYFKNAGNSGYLQKITSAGLADTNFGVGGLFTVSGEALLFVKNTLVAQADGSFNLGFRNATAYQIIHINSVGMMDNKFGTSGFASLPTLSGVTPNISSIIGTPDGGIAIVGSLAIQSNSATLLRGAFLKLNALGDLDLFFGVQGFSTEATLDHPVGAIGLLSNGQFLLGGATTDLGPGPAAALLKFSATGNLVTQ